MPTINSPGNVSYGLKDPTDHSKKDSTANFPRLRGAISEKVNQELKGLPKVEEEQDEVYQMTPEKGYKVSTVHLVTGSTVRIAYREEGNNIEGTVEIINYPDRSILREELLAQKQNHPEGPQGRIVFNIANNSYTKEERLQAIKKLEATLNVARTENPHEEITAYIRGRAFADMLEAREHIIEGAPGFKGKPRREISGLFALDPEAGKTPGSLQFKSQDEDRNYIALKNYAKTLQDLYSNNDWEFKIERYYVNENDSPEDAARKILTGDRTLKLTKVGKGAHKNTFGIDGDHFYQLELNQWDNGKFLSVFGGKPKIPSKFTESQTNLMPTERNKTEQQYAYEGDGRARLFLYLGEMTEPFENMERTMFAMAEKLAVDHEYTKGGKYLMRDSPLANYSLYLCDGQRRRQEDGFSKSMGIIGINDAVLHGVNWVRLGLADFIKRCHIRDSNIGIMSGSDSSQLNLWNNDVDDTRLLFRNSNGNGPAKFVSIRGGFYGWNVEVYGGIESGNLEAQWHCNMMDMDQFDVVLYQRWGIIQKYLNLRGSRINPDLVKDRDWRRLLAPVWPYFENWYYREARDQMLGMRELINIFTKSPQIGTTVRGDDDTPSATWGQAVARGQFQGKDGKGSFDLYVEAHEDDQKKKRDRRAGFVIVINHEAKDGPLTPLHIRPGPYDSAGKIWAKLLENIGSPHSLDFSTNVDRDARAKLKDTHQKTLDDATIDAARSAAAKNN